MVEGKCTYLPTTTTPPTIPLWHLHEKISMLSFLACLLLLAVLARKLLRDLKYSSFPGPSPFLSLPLIGHGYLLGSDVAEKLSECQRKYGDVFRFDVGAFPSIFLCSHEAVAEAFRKEAFSGRFFNELPGLQAVVKKNHRGWTSLSSSH